MSTFLRTLGILPLAFFAAYGVMAWSEKRADEIFWMCHVANVLLGCALLLDRPKLVRIATLWIVLGIPLWLIDAWVIRDIEAVSVVSHYGGLAVGLYALARIRMSENPWLAGVCLYVVVQQACRLLTDPALNVNLAHQVYAGSRGWFGRYEVYWLMTTVLAAVFLWAIGRLLAVTFPPAGQDRGEDGVLHRAG